MGYYTGADHVEIDINKAAYQVTASLNGSGMIAVFPESPFALLTLIEFLGSSPGNQLETLGDDIRGAIDDKQMCMIGGSHVVENPQAKTFFGFKEPGKPAPPVLGEFQEKFLFVATMGYVPHLPRNMMSICSCHP
jgi:hypothetical protein